MSRAAGKTGTAGKSGRGQQAAGFCRILGQLCRGRETAEPGGNTGPGAHCGTNAPDGHPYVFRNFTGDRRSILTLAHELGHGLHGYLAQPLGLFNANTPLTTAETASVFGEALTFKRLLAIEEDPSRRLNLLAGRIEDSIATVFRQVAMNRFEDVVHTTRRAEGEPSMGKLEAPGRGTQI